AQLANLVNAAIRSRVNLNHVQRRPRRSLLARIALAARLGRRPVHAVQRLGQDARRRGFPYAARSGKNVRVRHAIHLDRIGQRFCYMSLPDEVREGLRPPFSRNHLISHTCLGAPPFALFAKGRFIFGVRPEKVKTFGVRQLAAAFVTSTILPNPSSQAPPSRCLESQAHMNCHPESRFRPARPKVPARSERTSTKCVL